MLSINTNLSSLIAQNSLTQSTNKLNQAIERMTTGAKINHAKDNAANYSISTNMTTKMNAYMVAEDNVAMGLDMVATMSENLDLVSNHVRRIRDLCEQASNGTYGADSLKAIQSEIDARIAEVERLKSSAEFNGIKLFNTEQATPTTFATPRAATNEAIFISNPKTYDDATVNAMASIDTFSSGASGEFKIEDAEDLARLATLTNGGADTTNATFVLANDIDLASWCATNGNWVPIGKDSSYAFKGVFDGNGHIIKNLKIDNPTAYDQALFGVVGFNNNSAIKNVGIENASINGGEYAAALVAEAGCSSSTYIQNCFSEGNVRATGSSAGGLIGNLNYSDSELIDCYSTASVSGTYDVGGLVGYSSADITNSYATGNVSGTSSNVGGLVGSTYGTVTNCGAVQADNYATLMTKEEIYATIGIPMPTPPSPGGTGSITLQVGTNDDSNSQITFDLATTLAPLEITITDSDSARSYLTDLDNYLTQISDYQTNLGAVTNRLESALDEITIQYENLASSRSTIRDADIAKVSSQYIQQQILQQASATLMATANQAPAIALQLI